MFTWTFLSSFFGFQELLISFLRPKMLLKKLHVNIPLVKKNKRPEATSRRFFKYSQIGTCEHPCRAISGELPKASGGPREASGELFEASGESFEASGEPLKAYGSYSRH